jgi:hypothetical protein
MVKRVLIAPILALVIVVSSSFGVASAQQSGQGLEISPPLLDLKAKPGETLRTSIRLRNVTTGPVDAKAQYDDFVAGGEEGVPKLLEEGGEKSPYSIKDWLASVPTITLAPGEQKAVDLEIEVPDNASPGGHYGVVRFTAAAPNTDESAVSLSASVGTLVLVTVAGDIKEQANIEELSAYKNGKPTSTFEYGPVDIVTRIKNTGNVHVRPGGTVRITSMFGKEVASYNLNESRGSVLPGSIRKFENKLDKKNLFGRYTIQADIAYGEDQKIISQTSTFWVVPYKLVGLGLLALLGLVFLLRGYNKFILRKAAKKNQNTTQE